MEPEKYKVDKGIPIPMRRNANSASYPTLSEGQSFFIPIGDKTYQGLNSKLRSYYRSRKIDITTRVRIEETIVGIRVWYKCEVDHNE